ncbi:VWA domain-containing protein [Bacillus subtilis]|uniref:VWA domain-containing protein n=1 Tax=Bacillus subtilis TaxID=1423 RepID=UPI0024ACE1B9|nr:VWA domain-containing protein [Bacillus subtilis]MDI6567099.1 VWA domain-containing protein [Bacillus subtilis]
MDKLQEVKKFDITIFTSWLKKYAECGEGLEKAWHFLIEQAELAEKRQEIIEENKRQQEVTVHQFRQAQKDIQRITKESDGFKQALEKIAALKPSTNNDITLATFNLQLLQPIWHWKVM